MLEFIDADIESTDIDQGAEKRRFISVISVFQGALEQLNPELVSFHQLDNLNNNFKSGEVWGQILQYKENGAVSHLRNANDNMGNLLPQLPILLILAKKLAPEKPIRGLEKFVDEFTANISSKKSKTNEEIKKLSEEITTESKKVNELIEIVDARRQETDTRISEWQKQFSEAQESRINEYNQWRNKVEGDTKTEIQDQINKSRETLKLNQNEFNLDIERYLSDAAAKHQSILDLYELTASDSVGAGALKNADDEKNQADKWRWGVIIFIIAAVLWLGITIFSNIGIAEDGAILWIKLVKSASLTAILVFGATFCVHQTNKHRSSEGYMRWFSLKIKAIDPFLASVDAPQRAETKMRLSEKIFVQDHENTEAIKKGGVKMNIKDIVALISVLRVDK